MTKITAILLSTLAVAECCAGGATFSRAGYWDVPGSPRRVTSFNVGWQFSLDGFATSKDVNLPHSIDEGEIGLEVSGGVNRQQPAWYRRDFTWHRTLPKSFLHFEAIMGKCRVELNGRQVAEHFGGFLPIHVDVTDVLRDGENRLVVWCDNSDDPTYPPGTPQGGMDFCYFGGIYRDVWLVETGASYVADSDNGGVWVTSRMGTGGVWRVDAKVALAGEPGAQTELLFDGRPVSASFELKDPKLWSPQEPNLHMLTVRVVKDGTLTDAVGVRIGLRDFVIDGNGLALNGKPFGKVFGVNRHQDFAYIGMAMANSLHWRDAKKYRDAGFVCIRNAHYPQDPAFMDACDELGLFVVVTTPGWQFWNGDDSRFAARVYDDIEKMVRRDRSRPSLFMWEPILNETRYPPEFASRAREIVKRETCPPNDVCACDRISKGADEYDVLYMNGIDPAKAELPADKGRFYREWGDYVDDWKSQNSLSRVSRSWGEGPMLAQADHYINGTRGKDFFRRIKADPGPLFGGCVWHGADHARAAHPDNFYGGVLSYIRRRKYSWYAFKAALDPKPYAFLANALAPYSPERISIYSNVPVKARWLGESVKDGDSLDYRRMYELNYPYVHGGKGDPQDLVFVVMLPDGTRQEYKWARRFERILLELDTEGLEPVADGSDLVVATATMADREGTPRRYQDETVRFSVEGPATIVGENPQRTAFGEASVLLRLGKRGRPEPVRLTAELVRKGPAVPPPTTLEFVPGSPLRSLSAVGEAHGLSEHEKQQADFATED